MNLETLTSLLSQHPLAALGLVSSGAIVAVTRESDRRVAYETLAIGIAFAAIGAVLAAPGMEWTWVLASLPPLVVIQHAVFVARIKTRFVSKAKTPDQVHRIAERFKTNDAVGDQEVGKVYDDSEKYFAPETIALRYGIPSVLLFVIGLLVFHLLDAGSQFAQLSWAPLKEAVITQKTLEAARMGAAGAFVYVLIYLGNRAFRHDITSGAANWCVVTLVLGPGLAAIASKVWGSATATGAEQALYFLAGFSPRAVATGIEEFARRSFLASGQPPPSRTLPLSVIRGMTNSVAERLGEEGITDVSTLAMADPLRLQRDCNFDKRQILNWMDEALLCHFAPQHWQKLQDATISGAIDLGWYGGYGDLAQTTTDLTELATAIGVQPALLAQLSMRLRQDAQVRLVWVLYQMESGEGPPGGPPGGPPSGPTMAELEEAYRMHAERTKR